MEAQTLQAVVELVFRKEQNYRSSKSRYLVRAALASMFLGFGVIVAFKTGSFFYNIQSPFTYPIAAFTFGTAIVLIAYGGGDLFTGNAFYFTYAALNRRMKWRQAVWLWCTTYGGNLLGAIAFAFLIYGTGLFNESSVNAFLLKSVDYKMNAPATELFFRGILCNWLICLAFFIPLSLKTDGPKLFLMMLLVFCFFISGYEHSIANMCAFAIALVIDHPESISLYGALHNLVPVTLGNLVGGGLIMGVMYWYLNNQQEKG